MPVSEGTQEGECVKHVRPEAQVHTGKLRGLGRKSPPSTEGRLVKIDFGLVAHVVPTDVLLGEAEVSAE